jgi:hypothetical protein
MNPQVRSSGIVAQWGAIRRVYPIYTAVAEQFGLRPAPYPSLDQLAADSEADVIRNVESWLGEMDDCIEPHQFRHILESTDILNSEDKLHVLVRRHLGKEHRSEGDRAKLHYLLTQYLVVCIPPSFRSREVKLDEVAQVLEAVLGEMPTSVPESLEPLTCLVEQMPKCSSLGELQSSILEPGRELKAHALDSHFDTAALVVFTYFNYSARGAFRRLISAEVRAVEEGLRALESHDIKTLNCTSAGLSAEEPVEAVRKLLEEMKTSVAPAYSIDSAGKQIRALRLAISAAVDRATTALTESDRARFGAMEAHIQRLVAEVTQLKRDLSSVRTWAARVATQSNSAPASPSQPAAPRNGTVADGPTPDASPAMKVPPAQATVPAAGNWANAKPNPTERDVATQVDSCIEQLQKLLGDGSIKASGLLKIGTETVLLAGGDIDAIRSTGEVALLAQRAIATRILLIKFIENARRGHGGDVAPLSVFAQSVLVDLQRVAPTSAAPTRDALASNGRQLRTVLQHAESVVRKARMAAQSA